MRPNLALDTMLRARRCDGGKYEGQEANVQACRSIYEAFDADAKPTAKHVTVSRPSPHWYRSKCFISIMLAFVVSM
jgi:hypothetical protein